MDEVKLIEPSSYGLENTQRIASVALCDAYGRSGIGGRAENQDSYSGLCVGENIILTVCDGMGGMNGGQTASSIAANEIVQSLAKVPSEKMGKESLMEALEVANAAIYQKALEEPPLRGMGTTATILVLTPFAAYVTHIGDSRIYQLRKGKKIFRTFDHSRVFEMVAQKMMTEEQARQSSFSNIITRALGIRPKIEASIEMIPYKKGDRFVLCCDGVWNSEPENEIIRFFNEQQKTDEAVSVLMEKINGLGEQRGGNHDNLTVIIADMKKNSKYQYGWFKRIKRRFK